MPRKDRENSRKWLKVELIRCGFSEEEAHREVSEFTGDNITSINSIMIEKLVREVRERTERRILQQVGEKIRLAVSLLEGLPGVSDTAPPAGR